MDSQCIEIWTRPQLRSLVAEIRRQGRVAPVVALTSRAWEKEPAFRPDAVRAIVGLEAQIYSIPTGHLTNALAVKLGKRLAVSEGDARIWWAGACRHTAEAHPLVPAPPREDDRQALQELERSLKTSRPMTAGYVEMLEAERSEATQHSNRLESTISHQARELAEARLLLEAKQAMLIDAKAQLRSLRTGGRRAEPPRVHVLP